MPRESAVRVHKVHHSRRPKPSQFPPRKSQRRSHGPPGEKQLEINLDEPQYAVFNADMELAMRATKVGRSDNRRARDGGIAIGGEQEPLAKANATWPSSCKKQELLDSGYLTSNMQRLTMHFSISRRGATLECALVLDGSSSRPIRQLAGRATEIMNSCSSQVHTYRIKPCSAISEGRFHSDKTTR